MNPIRFRQARLAAGMSLRELSEFLRKRGLQLSHAALHKYEAGSARPGPRALFVIAEALGAPAHAFLREPTAQIEWLAYRRRAGLTTTARTRIAATATRAVEQHLEIEKRLAVVASDRFPKPRPVRSGADAEELAEAVRQAWSLGRGPLESVGQTIEDHGGVVVEVTPPRAGFDGLSGRLSGRRPVVVVASEAPADRRRYTLAHELGHLAMETEGIAAELQERCAHRFAAAFLVPADSARRELGARRRHLDLGELKPLKLKYGLSIQAWMRRALDLEIITATSYTRLCRQVSALGWRRSEPGEYVGEGGLQRLRQLLLRGLSEGLVSVSEAEHMLPGVSQELLPGQRAAPSRAGALLRGGVRARERAMSHGARALELDYRAGGTLREFDAHDAADIADDSDES